MNKRVLTVSLTLLLIMALVSCQATPSSTTSITTTKSASTTTTTNTTKPSESTTANHEPPKLTVAVPDNVKVEDYETNGMTLLLEEQAGVDLTFDIYPATDYVTKLNLMVMSGGNDLPDVLIATPGDVMVYAWAEAGAIIPVTQFYDDPAKSVHLHEAIERTGVNFFSQMVAPDGEIYGLPAFNMSYSNTHLNKLWYYEPWLVTLGQSVPKTTEDLYQLLKQIISTDLNGNGKNDEIGITGQINQYYNDVIRSLMNAFVYAGDQDYFVVENGKVSVAYNTDGWKDGLKYIKKLITEGLMPVETLTQDGAQFTTLKKSDPLSIFMFAGNAMGSLNQDVVYTGMPPLTGPNGVQWASWTEPTASVAGMISKNCQEQEAAFRLLDLMCSEHFSIVTRWGEEGINWDYYKNVKNQQDYISVYPGWDVFICAYDDQGFWGSTTVQNGSWLQIGPYIRQYAIANGSGKSPASLTPLVVNNAACNIMYHEGKWSPTEYIPKLVYTPDEIDQVGELMSTIKSYAVESFSGFVTGNIDIDTGWDAYITELNAIGLDTILEVVQGIYDRMYK